MTLHPTLWRTCRILAGETRLRLLRQVVKQPGQTVTALADSARIKISRASQELRRLQSRGLVQAKRHGGNVSYFPAADPLVPTAKPVLTAMKTAFTSVPPPPDHLALAIAIALSYPRRIELVRELKKGSRRIGELKSLLRIPAISLYRHLQVLERLDLVRPVGQEWHFTPNRHPLTRCLVQLVEMEDESPTG